MTISAAKHDVSPPLREIVPPLYKIGTNREVEIHRIPNLQDRAKPSPNLPDPLLGHHPLGLAAPMPAPLLTFEGTSDADNAALVGFEVVPPDTNGDVGPNNYVQWNNLVFEVFDKSGNTVLGPLPGNTLFAGFGGPCETTNDGDPVVTYDQLADRWVLSQFAINEGTQCVAVSQTGDPTGAYYRYAFVVTPGAENDYPKIGIWSDAYYATFRKFSPFEMVAAAFERDKMLQGQPAQLVLFTITAPAGPGCTGAGDCYEGVLPASLEGITPPPPGSPGYFVMSFDDEAFSTTPDPTQDFYKLWRFHVDWANTANSTFTGPVSLSTPEMDDNLCGFNPCVPQQGSSELLDSLSFFTMHRLIYRNFGDHESLWANNSVNLGSDRAGIRWAEIRDPNGSPAVFQTGTLGPADGLHRWMGSLSVDKDGNMALGYSLSGTTAFPSIAYSGRLAGDPLGTLPQTETMLFAGTGSQISSFNRWGDYSAMSVDDLDGCTFWYTNEYYAVTNSFDFHTRIGAFKFPSCTPTASGSLTGTVTDASTSAPIAGASVQAGSFSTVTNGSGVYNFAVLPVGTYSVTASAFGYSAQTVNGVVISEGATTTQNFSLSGAPSHMVSGTVRDQDGVPLSGATVVIQSTPIAPATTDSNGNYSFPSVPEGEYDVTASAGRCNNSQTQHLVVAGNVSGFDFSLPQRQDAFGYFCRVETPGYVEANTITGISGDDVSGAVSLPFPFTFYGQSYSTANVCTNGLLSFNSTSCPFSNAGIPNTGAPNAMIAPYWDDLYVDASASIRADVFGSQPNRTFVIEWRNVRYFSDNGKRFDFEVILHENGQIQTEYRNIDPDPQEQGNSATLGIENESGTVGLQYSTNEAVISSPAFAVLYRIPPSGFIQGTITDANDHGPIAGATVRALQGSTVAGQTTTDASGFYRLQLRLGTYDVDASASNYGTGSASGIVLDTEGETITQDFQLQTARGAVSPSSLQFIVPANQTRTATLTLSNTGGLDMTWSINEVGARPTLQAPTGAKLVVGEKVKNFDPSAASTKELYRNGPATGWPASAPGNVITSWPIAGMSLGWGVGYTGNVWLSDAIALNNKEFTTAGAATGTSWGTPWVGAWPGDMAYDASRGLMCQVNVGGDDGIYCWNPATGAVAGSITGSFPWTGISQRGLAYRADDDSFYIGGWNEGILYHVKGLSYADKGAVIGQCNAPDPNISGLAWNPAAHIVWEATNSATDTIYELDPDTCAVLATLPFPQSGGFQGAGLEMNEVGNLWATAQSPNVEYLIDSGVPSFTDVPWLSENPTSGTVAAGGSQAIQVTVNTTGLTPGVYNAHLYINTNSGRQPTLQVAINLIVPAYSQNVNSGDGNYTDGDGDIWAADQAWSAGSWGHVGKVKTTSTNAGIAGTNDDPLYQSADTGQIEYRFDGLPNGTYEVTLRFAEIENRRPGQRLFDVTINGAPALVGFDIAGEVGKNAADEKTFFVPVSGGQVDIRFLVRRGYHDPIINAIRVRNRPDR